MSMHLIKDNRETPVEFKNLYEAAWKDKLDSRPDIKKICKKLDNIQLDLFCKELFKKILLSKYSNIPLLKTRKKSVKEVYEEDNYYMVLQYADSSDLEQYLKKNFSELDWSTKIRMAKEISSGIDCLHNANIVHRDLHSDIYSLGVLFWELSSGVAPFAALKIGLIKKVVRLIKGTRETVINKTPIDFKNLYDAAWSGIPNSRPDIKDICKKLDNIRLEQVL
ncbi:kinase-like protein [Gigaspora margarita]|uniref:Kinase-like protein n=1 Tax=Gigaspora margarita TaxID=4874 RepID=A0A8H3XH14_GIGMA|nr:kinase-like protein [Gigaspora margarita]